MGTHAGGPDDSGRRAGLTEEPPSRLVGGAASPGLLVGRALLFERRRVNVPKRHVEDSEVETEVARLRGAIDAARAQLRAIRATLPEDSQDHSLILEAHLLMLDDALLVDDTEDVIRVEKINAEWGLRRTVEKIKALFERAEDDYFRERRSDVDFVGERVLRQLMGHSQELPKAHDDGQPTILVAHELSPADIASLPGKGVAGFVTDVGSTTSHTAILARAMQLVAVVGAQTATKFIATGDLLVLDGLKGVVVLRPGAADLLAADRRKKRYALFVKSLDAQRDRIAAMKCGTPVALRANIELPPEAQIAVDHGADGVGLYRTEFLYIDRRSPPPEEEQFEVYRGIVKTVSPRIVTLRTFDIGGDKFSTAFRLPREMNPALGLRAVRLALQEREVFRTQLRAMLRAAMEGPVRIMVPMIATLSELREVKTELALARQELAERNIHVNDVPLGVMIETPSAVFMADQLARESAFFSIGTNDLVQYSLAIDRGNEHVAFMARPFDPAILRAISMTVRAAHAAGIPCSLCGTMASDLLAAPLLVGLGLRELSVDPHAIASVKAALSRITLREAEALAVEVLDCDTAETVKTRVEAQFAGSMRDLLEPAE
ncbi:MAG: phosphoenolpyruvate--protein phosphotransferase [Deltaproteobacteria bacterium]|nr:phosphoenolpyruvate--protein phosphotransferase [Deltaproteobacteria bacterium]